MGGKLDVSKEDERMIFRHKQMSTCYNKPRPLAQTLESFFEEHHKSFTKMDHTFLYRSLAVEDPFPHFYITAKVHKTPWKTRPIVWTSGSILHDGLGIPTYLKSSFELKNQLSSLRLHSLLPTLPVSMYTNIDTTQALLVISQFLRTHPLCQNIYNIDSENRGLEILMRNNLFQFGNTYWLQLEGTAMGTPPVCMYATPLYFAIYEIELLTHFNSSLAFYCRYIDDCFAIWLHHPDPNIDHDTWISFKVSMQCFGKLEWEFTDHVG
jgi:hypothetical protein